MYINILELFYPIDSIYMSFNDTSPAEFIGGTWEKLENKVIRAGNDTLSGGSDTHTLTVDQIPSHNHTYFKMSNSGGWVITANSGGYYNGGNATTTSSGGSKAHNNLPAYQNIYIWRRIS